MRHAITAPYFKWRRPPKALGLQRPNFTLLAGVGLFKAELKLSPSGAPAAGPSRSLSDQLQGVVQSLDDVVNVLDADGEPDQIVMQASSGLGLA